MWVWVFSCYLDSWSEGLLLQLNFEWNAATASLFPLGLQYTWILGFLSAHKTTGVSDPHRGS